MPDETIFQIIAVLSIVAFLAVRAYYRRKTGTLHFDLSGSRDSKGMTIFLFILYILFLGLLLWLMNPNWMSWSALPLPDWVRGLGVAIVVIALALLIWVHQTLSTSFSGNLEIRAQHQLVTTGPYRWVRHPMYSVIFLWAAGLAVITANWFVGLIPVAFAIFFILRVPKEEKMMIEAFGAEYRDFMKQTGRFLPHLVG